jgi:high affinity sulfate transporter 1
VLPDVIGGVTLAALAVPEVLGYARIAGMPIVTGLYTMLVPMVAFALLGSSRHLVVGADSATAAILAAGIVGVAPGSPRYVQLAGTAALLVAALLVLARLLRLGFLANFLSRTVLVGFLTGVGIHIAFGQLGELLGVAAGAGSPPLSPWQVLAGVPRTHLPTLSVSLVVIAVVVAVRLLARRIPGPLLAVVGAIVASEVLHLAAYGVEVIGAVPAGVPRLTVPGLSPTDLRMLLPVAVSMAVVILAQSAATSRAYGARYDESVDTDRDLVGLGAANLGAALTGTFVVNGSPTKTQMVDSAGGRSQLSQLAAVGVVLIVILTATGPLAALPLAALAAVVFLIGIELIDVAGMRRIYSLRREEFVVAVVTAAAVVFLGVEQGILLAIAASIVDHLRHSYEPRSSVLAKSSTGHWHSSPVTPGARTADGLVIYRFGSGLYFANASQFAADVTTLTGSAATGVRWFCLDAAAIGDVDYTAAAVLTRVHDRLRGAGIRLVLAGVIDPVRTQLDRYGLSTQIGVDGFYETAGEVLAEFQSGASGSEPR